MYASDYPFNVERDGSVPRFLDTAPISDAEREAIAFRNRESLGAPGRPVKTAIEGYQIGLAKRSFRTL